MSEKKIKKENSKELLQSPKGMRDVLPDEMLWWEKVSKSARELSDFYNFSKIDTPILESVNLFAKGVGEDTEIVEKEMYTLKTKGGDNLALRPEATAAVMRAYFEHHLGRSGQAAKLFLQGPMFRHENTQAGRLRQFTQVDFEIIGGQNDPLYDAQIIQAFYRLCEDLKLKSISLKINSIGCRVCRPGYKRQLQAYYKSREKKICSDCQRRLKTNPLRLLDCKKPECAEHKEKAPSFFDKLCVTCSEHLKSVLEYLDELGIPYALDNKLVRGLDYYSRTVFEFFVEGNGEEVGAIAGGGRYDYLAEMLGMRPTPGVGGAASIERLVHVMKAQDVKLPVKNLKKVFFIHVGELAKKKSLKVIEALRKEDIFVIEALGKDSLKSQLKSADKEGIELALIFGQKEIFEESIIIRDLKRSLQETVPLHRLVLEIKKRLKN